MAGISQKNENKIPCRFCLSNLKRLHTNQAKNPHVINPKCDMCTYGMSYFSKIPDDIIDHVVHEHLPVECTLCGQTSSLIDEFTVHKKCWSTKTDDRCPIDFQSCLLIPVDKASRDSVSASPSQKRQFSFGEVVQEGADVEELLHREEREKSSDSYESLDNDHEDDEGNAELFESCCEMSPSKENDEQAPTTNQHQNQHENNRNSGRKRILSIYKPPVTRAQARKALQDIQQNTASGSTVPLKNEKNTRSRKKEESLHKKNLLLKR